MLAEDRLSGQILEFLPLIEQELKSFLTSSLQAFDATREVVEYAVLSPGKRLRPLLVLAVARDFGCEIQSVLRPALALELFHASSLIHDDLPALDDDDYRRGRASCHKKYGEARAILAGDLLIAQSFRCISDSELRADEKSLCIEKLTLSFSAVCEGQVRDIDDQDSDIEAIHNLKTASLFEAAAYLGVVQSQNRQELFDVASQFGRTLGMFFQAYNDLLDVTGSDQQRGRPGSSDGRNAKVTLFQGQDTERSRAQLVRLEEAMLLHLDMLESLLPEKSTGMVLTRDYVSLLQARLSEL